MNREIFKKTDKACQEHLDPMQLARFKEKKLNEAEREEVFKHLSHCKECREVLSIASQIEKEEQKRKPLNNINYKKYSRLVMASSFAVLFFAVPNLAGYPDESSFKNVEERGVLEKTLDYWEHRFEDLIGGDKE